MAREAGRFTTHSMRYPRPNNIRVEGELEFAKDFQPVDETTFRAITSLMACFRR